MRRALILLFSIFLVLGCDNDPDPVDAGDTDAGPDSDAGADSSLPPGGDGNDSFADADPLTIGDAPTPGRIGVPDDLDYYTFDGTGGDWIVIRTETEDPGDGSEFTDCVLQLFDSSMTMIAENDDAIPRGVVGTQTDSEIIIRLPETGVYYAVVQEFSSWSDLEMTPSEGGMDYLYAVVVEALDGTTDFNNIETEMGTTPIVSTHVRNSLADYGLIAGDADTGDVDVYTFTLAHRRNTSFQLMPMGPTGHGSTALPARMWITNAAGTEIIARIVDTDMLDTINPPLPDMGDYQIHVEASGTPGANPFYVLRGFRRSRDNDLETEEATNGDPTTPEVLTLEPDMPTTEDPARQAFVRPDLAVGDVDWFQFDVRTGEQIAVACGSRTAGSGIEDLRLTIFNSDGTMELGTSTETATEGAFVNELVVAPGNYLFRLDRGAQIADVTGTWVRCGVSVAPPPPAP